MTGRLWKAVLVAAIIGGLVFGLTVYAKTGKNSNESTRLLYTVESRSLRDTVVERGTLESQKTVQGFCEVPGGGKIVFIVPEGSQIEAGQEVVRFDTENVDKLIAQKKLKSMKPNVN